MNIQPNETEIRASWENKDGRLLEDAAGNRIKQLVATELKQIGVSKDGWEKLYIDPRDGRYWVLFYPQSEMHGGGPPALRVISAEVAQQEYVLNENMGTIR